MKEKFCKAMYYLRYGFDRFLSTLFLILLVILFLALLASLTGALWQMLIDPTLSDCQALFFGFKFETVVFAILFIFRLMNFVADEGKKIIDKEKSQNQKGKENE